MATVNIHQVSFSHALGAKIPPTSDTSLVAAAVGVTAPTLNSTVKNNYKTESKYQDSTGKSAGTSDSRSINVDAQPILFHGVLSTGATGITSLYKVRWHNSRNNAANTQFNDTLVHAAAGSNAVSLGSTIQTNNGDGLTVTVDEVVTMLTGILA